MIERGVGGSSEKSNNCRRVDVTILRDGGDYSKKLKMKNKKSRKLIKKRMTERTGYLLNSKVGLHINVVLNVVLKKFSPIYCCNCWSSSSSSTTNFSLDLLAVCSPRSLDVMQGWTMDGSIANLCLVAQNSTTKPKMKIKTLILCKLFVLKFLYLYLLVIACTSSLGRASFAGLFDLSVGAFFPVRLCLDMNSLSHSASMITLIILLMSLCTHKTTIRVILNNTSNLKNSLFF